jgi:hypothetical protein
VYVSGGKVRTDFTGKSASGTISGHMIADSATVHTWMDGMSQGFTTSITAQATTSNNSQQGVSPDTKVQTSCEPWSADASLFVVPSNITFTDPSAMMKAGASGSANSCAVCDQAPASARAQCRAALHCK